MSGNIFTQHPHDIGESYGLHFRNAAWVGFTMVGCGIAVLVHSVLPFLFVKTGSRTIAALHRRTTGRIDRHDWERHPII